MVNILSREAELELLETIGVRSKRKKVNGRMVTVYTVNNLKRFESYIPEDKKQKN